MIYLLLFWTFFKIGLFTFGGGYAMIPLIQEDVVYHYQWMTMAQFTEFIGIAESTPGPFAINIATFVGTQVASNAFLGSLCTTTGVVLPSLIIILLIASLFQRVTHHWVVQSALRGAKPAVVALIGVAATTLFLGMCIPNGEDITWTPIIVAVGLYLVAYCCKLGAITLILLGAGLGLLLFGVCGLPY